MSVVAVLRYHGAVVPDRAGRFAIRCSYHDDSVKSGFVDVPRDFYKCYACGVVGTSLALVMYHDGLDEDAARRILESLVGPGGVSLRRQPERAGTYLSYKPRNNGANRSPRKPRRRYFPHSWA